MPQHRSFTRPFFSRTNSSLYDPVATLEPHTEKLMDLIMGTAGDSNRRVCDEIERNASSETRPGNPVDVQSLFLTYTLDVASEFFFGHCVGGLDKLVQQCDGASAEANADIVENDITGEELTKAFAEAQVSRRARYNPMQHR